LRKVAQLIDPAKTANDEPFEVELKGNAQIEVTVEAMVVSDEGACGSATSERLQHRCLYF